jgi:hypothetical protein
MEHSQTDSTLDSDDSTGGSEITVGDIRDLVAFSSLRAQCHMYKINPLHCQPVYAEFQRSISNIQLQQPRLDIPDNDRSL